MSKKRYYKSLRTLAKRLRDDLNPPVVTPARRNVKKPRDVLLISAYNRTGKTRLSMEFKEKGKTQITRPFRVGDRAGAPLTIEETVSDTLYFNAYTEDLFVWENDLEGDSNRHLKLNADSNFFNGLTDLALDETIADYLSRYADFDFDIHIYEQTDYPSWRENGKWDDSESLRRLFEEKVLGKPSHVSFKKGDEENIKISRGEENIFIWCLFMAICERVLDGHDVTGHSKCTTNGRFKVYHPETLF